MKTRNGAALSMPAGETVRGYEIRRLPLGEYLRMIEVLRQIAGALAASLFPGMDVMQTLASLKRMDVEMLTDLMLRAMEAIPGEAVKLLSVMTGVSCQQLLDDPAIGLDGAMDMLEAFWRLNGIGNFTQAAARMAAGIKSLRTQTGCSA